MKLINEELLDVVTGQAKENPRLRMNYNFHESMDAPIHRMLNALEPGTYLPPHRHQNPDKEEVYLVLRGSLLAILFDEEGNVTKKVNLNPLKGNYGVEIPPRVWHSIVVLEPNTVIYEIKQGPFAPLTSENLAPWAPAATDDKEKINAFMKRMIEL
ncbi:WbuC family cupin fold metalloprotein [Bacteroides sp.]